MCLSRRPTCYVACIYNYVPNEGIETKREIFDISTRLEEIFNKYRGKEYNVDICECIPSSIPDEFHVVGNTYTWDGNKWSKG